MDAGSLSVCTRLRELAGGIFLGASTHVSFLLLSEGIGKFFSLWITVVFTKRVPIVVRIVFRRKIAPRSIALRAFPTWRLIGGSWWAILR
ncbi:hypothetical protein AJ87_44195 [Rhizobium yanglingense]|nr:hypothetical protein AJ87_44195 [Rhizobium yanglingense]